MQYDKVVDTATATHDEEVDAIESSASINLIHDTNEKFTNKLTLANTYIKEFMELLRIAVMHFKIITMAKGIYPIQEIIILI